MMLACCGTIALAETENPTECSHELTEYQLQERTCETDGIVRYSCWKCGYEDTVITPAAGHTFGEWYYEYEWDEPDCEYEGTMIQKCQNEGCSTENVQTVPALGHDFENIVEKATPYNDGYIERICSRCYDYDYDCDYYDNIIYAPSKIKLSNTKYTYNGYTKKPTVKVYNDSGYLINAKHYTVSYQKGRKLVGKYKVTVTFKKSSDKYSGKMTTYFNINPKSTSITKLIKGNESFTVKWKKAGKLVSGYQIRYCESSDMYDAGYKTIKSAGKASAKISNLWEDEKYYVQIRTYKTVNGKKFYSAWSKKKTVRTKTAPSSYSDDDGYSGPIYVTRTGECYHTHACGNGTYYLSTLSAALARGLRPCQKCF
jgi:hypothetical protein